MDLRISTMTACAEVPSNIDLSQLYKQTHLSDLIKLAMPKIYKELGWRTKNNLDSFLEKIIKSVLSKSRN